MTFSHPVFMRTAWLSAILSLLCASVVSADHLLSTRHFSGAWMQADHEIQGIMLHIADRGEDAARAQEKGQIEVIGMDGMLKGKLKSTEPERADSEILGFDPRGAIIEVLLGDAVILESLFPEE